MLSLMRTHATSWLIKILLAAIVLVFVFWGVGSFRSRRAALVASVNGETILLDEYKQTYDNLIEQYRQIYGNRLDETMLKTLNLKKQALDQLISQKILVQEARKMNIRVSKQELVDSIRSISAFQSNGSFDQRRYEMILQRMRTAPEEFEMQQKKSLLVEKLRSLLTDGVNVSEAEARAWYDWENAQVKIDYVLFEPAAYTDIDPSEEALLAYYEENKSNYKTEPRAKVKYIRFNPETFAPDVAIEDRTVQDYYDAHPDEFKSPKTVEARHILLKLEEDAAPEVVAEKKEKITEILKKAREGEDFAELAKEFSEGPTKDKGGYLGEFKKEAMVKPFADAAFSMEAGGISEPVRTQFGWHIIKVEKVTPESAETLEDAREKIVQKLTDEKAKERAQARAEEVYDMTYAGDDLDRIAAQNGLAAATTDFFTKTGPEDVPQRSRFAAAAFALAPGDISDVKTFADNFFLIQMIEKIPAGQAEFDAVKDTVKTDYMRAEQDEGAREDARDFLEAVSGDDGRTMEALSAEKNMSVQTTEFFERTGSIPKLGYEREMAETAFRLNAADPFPEQPVKGRKGYYVIRFKERKTPEAEAFEKEKADVRKKLLDQKQFKAFETWLSQLRDQSEIRIEQEFVN